MAVRPLLGARPASHDRDLDRPFWDLAPRWGFTSQLLFDLTNWVPSYGTGTVSASPPVVGPFGGNIKELAARYHRLKAAVSGFLTVSVTVTHDQPSCAVVVLTLVGGRRGLCRRRASLQP